MGVLAGLIAMLGWGSGDFLAALSSRRIGNLKTLFWMQITSFCIASIFFIINFQTFKLTAVPQYLILLFMVALLQVTAYLSFYKGLEEGMISVVSPIGSTFALVTTILSIVFYGEQLNSHQVLAIVVVFIGIFLVSTNIKELLGVKKLSFLKGVRDALIAMLGWGISLFLIVPASKALGWFLPVYIFKFFVLFLIITVFLFKKQIFKIKKQFNIVLLLLAVGIFDISAFFGYSLGVSSEYASIVAPISGAFAMITVLLARLFLKEKLVPNQIIGILAIVLGIIIINI